MGSYKLALSSIETKPINMAILAAEVARSQPTFPKVSSVGIYRKLSAEKRPLWQWWYLTSSLDFGLFMPDSVCSPSRTHLLLEYFVQIINVQILPHVVTFLQLDPHSFKKWRISSCFPR